MSDELCVELEGKLSQPVVDSRQYILHQHVEWRQWPKGKGVIYKNKKYKY